MEATAAHATGDGASGTVFNVQRASFHDGPGIRTTVFLKGCPLRCPWCHNPEGIAPRPEVLVNQARCLGCGACAAACPRPGGPLPAGAEVGSDGCAGCLECAVACPARAREIAGRRWTAAAVVAEATRDRMAYEESGGGVTFSGGEPLAQAAFVLDCLERCRAAGLRTAVDTCGVAPRAVVLAVAERADLLLWDVKTLDPERHRALTGAPLAPILGNLEAASRRAPAIWLRVPVVPGLTDDEAGVEAVARLAAATPNVRRVSLLPYHRTAAGKRSRLGREEPLAGTAEPSRARMEVLAALVARTGIETTIGG